MNAPGRHPAARQALHECVGARTAAIAMFQENDMQPKSIHGAAPGFRVLDQNAASAVVRRHMRPTQCGRR